MHISRSFFLFPLLLVGSTNSMEQSTPSIQEQLEENKKLAICKNWLVETCCQQTGSPTRHPRITSPGNTYSLEYNNDKTRLELQQNNLLYQLPHTQGLSSATFSQKDQYLCLITSDEAVTIYTLTRGTALHPTLLPVKNAQQVLFGPREDLLAVLSGKTCTLFSLLNQTPCAYTQFSCSDSIVQANFCNENLISVTTKNTVYLYDCHTKQVVYTKTFEGEPILAAFFNQTAEVAAILFEKKFVTHWRTSEFITSNRESGISQDQRLLSGKTNEDQTLLSVLTASTRYAGLYVLHTFRLPTASNPLNYLRSTNYLVNLKAYWWDQDGKQLVCQVHTGSSYQLQLIPALTIAAIYQWYDKLISPQKITTKAHVVRMLYPIIDNALNGKSSEMPIDQQGREAYEKLPEDIQAIVAPYLRSRQPINPLFLPVPLFSPVMQAPASAQKRTNDLAPTQPYPVAPPHKKQRTLSLAPGITLEPLEREASLTECDILREESLAAIKTGAALIASIDKIFEDEAHREPILAETKLETKPKSLKNTAQKPLRPKRIVEK